MSANGRFASNDSDAVLSPILLGSPVRKPPSPNQDPGTARCATVCGRSIGGSTTAMLPDTIP